MVKVDGTEVFSLRKGRAECWHCPYCGFHVCHERTEDHVPSCPVLGDVDKLRAMESALESEIAEHRPADLSDSSAPDVIAWRESNFPRWELLAIVRRYISMFEHAAMREIVRANTAQSVCREAPSGYRHSGNKTPVHRIRPMLASEVRSYMDRVSHALALSHRGEVRRVKINGAVKTWKRDTSRVEVPLKYGLYEMFRDSARSDGTMHYLIVDCDKDGELAAY